MIIKNGVLKEVTYKDILEDGSFVVPEGVTRIDYDAFEGCSSLKEVKIPSNVTRIGNDAFNRCSSLKEVKIPSSVTSIGESVFSRCSGLSRIIVEEGNPIYDSREDCNAIIEKETNSLIQGCKNTKIPEGITIIGRYAFYGCSNLTEAKIPSSVTLIGAGAFCGCSSLTKVEIPDGVTKIGENAFWGCSGLKEAKIPSSVRDIYAEAFEGCSSLTKAEIPNGVTEIGKRAFHECSGLKELRIPESVTSIGDEAFRGCSSLEKLEIEYSDNRVNIGKWAFLECDNVKDITAPESLMDEVYRGNVETVRIPKGETEIRRWKFYFHNSKHLEIPDSVKRIGFEAFEYCKELKEITIPEYFPAGTYLLNSGINFDKLEKINISGAVPREIELKWGERNRIRRLSELDVLRMGEFSPNKIIFGIFSVEQILKMDYDSIDRIAKFDKEIGYDDTERLISFMNDKNASGNLKRYIKEVLSNAYSEHAELINKGEKFEKIAHFIPNFHVVEKYPEDQIEKFNKKIWFNLARHDLYNQNVDTKNALVEAILSLGVFEKDEGQEERLGLLQKFATYLPKEIVEIDEKTVESDLIKEHFEIVDKKVVETKYYLNKEKILNDPNILSLFHSREEAEQELDKLNEKYDPEEMESVLQKEYVNDYYKDIMDYIYRFGYDKVEKYEYKVKLKTDIQKLKIKDKKRGQELENKIRKFYYEHDVADTMTSDKLHRIFDGMDMKYKEGFYEFFRDNLAQIIKEPEKQSELSKIQNQWEKIVETNLGQKITFEKCETYIYNNKYSNVQENEKEIAKLSSSCGYSQEDFEEVQKIFGEQLKRTESSIPQIEKQGKSGYSYKVLRLDDPVAIFVGELTDCCQALGDAGESCMRHSVTSPNGRILVVQDDKGKVISQSWIWRNKNVLCLDNIEAVQKDSDNKKIVSSEILDMVKQAAKDFVDTDKKHLIEWEEGKTELLKEDLEQGKISKEQFKSEVEKIEKIIKGQQLSRVTVGVGYTDINLKGLKRDKENRYPEEYVKYISDSRTQLVLYEDETVENEKTDIKTVAIYSDSEDSKSLVDIDTTEIEYDDDEYDDDEYDDDEYDYDEYDYDEYDDDEYDDDEYDDDEYDYDEYDYDEYDDEYDEEYDEENSNPMPDIKFRDEVYDGAKR